MLLARVILYLSNLSSVIPIWTGRRSRSIIWYYVWASFIADVVSFILGLRHIKWHWLSNLFLLVEFFIVSYFFTQQIEDGKTKKAVQLVLLMVMAGFAVHTNFKGAAVLYGIFLVFGIAGLYKVIKEIEFVQVERSPLFVLCVAFLLYGSGIFILLLFENELIVINKHFIVSLWRYLHNPLNIIKNILIGYALYLESNAKKLKGEN